MSAHFSVFLLKFFDVYLFLKERETECEHGRGAEKETQNPKRIQALSCQHRARRGARTGKPRDHDLSRSQRPTRLSHPGAPSVYISKKRDVLLQDHRTSCQQQQI